MGEEIKTRKVCDILHLPKMPGAGGKWLTIIFDSPQGFAYNQLFRGNVRQKTFPISKQKNLLRIPARILKLTRGMGEGGS